ncbi:hypothetical protein FRB95_010593 [Tulasnella sp. JGI-2019a]|nr:hypothetical protein FRB95_010593 [Tulasnella sp. JGI-2019a]
MFNKLWPLSSSTPPPRTEADEATASRDAEQSQRREQYIQRGRQHNESVDRTTLHDDDNDDYSDGDDDDDAASTLPAKRNSKVKRTGRILTRVSDELPLVKVDAGAIVVSRPELVPGSRTVERTNEALCMVKSLTENKAYKDGDLSIIRHNLMPSIANAIGSWLQEVRSPASQAIDLFTGQTLELARLMHMALYHVTEGQSLCHQVIEILTLVVDEGGVPPIDEIQDLRRRIDRQVSNSKQSLKEFGDLSEDVEWAKRHISGLTTTEYVSARKTRSVWEGINKSAGSILGASTVFGVGAGIVAVATKGGAHVEATQISDTVTKVLGGLGWAASALGYQTKELQEDAQEKKSRGELLALTFESIVNIEHCVKTFKHTFQTLEFHFCLPFFDETPLEDNVVLSKWRAVEVLFRVVCEQLKAMTKVTKDHRVEPPLNPYELDAIPIIWSGVAAHLESTPAAGPAPAPAVDQFVPSDIVFPAMVEHAPSGSVRQTAGPPEASSSSMVATSTLASASTATPTVPTAPDSVRSDSQSLLVADVPALSSSQKGKARALGENVAADLASLAMASVVPSQAHAPQETTLRVNASDTNGQCDAPILANLAIAVASFESASPTAEATTPGNKDPTPETMGEMDAGGEMDITEGAAEASNVWSTALVTETL